MPIVGLLNTLAQFGIAGTTSTHLGDKFKRGVADGGNFTPGNVTYATAYPAAVPANNVVIVEFFANGDYSALSGKATTLVGLGAFNVIVAAGGLVSSQAMIPAMAASASNKDARLLFVSGRTKADQPSREHPPYKSGGLFLETTRKSLNDVETRKRAVEGFDPVDIFHLVNDQSVVSNDESGWDLDQIVIANSTGAAGVAGSIATAVAAAVGKGAKALVVSADPFFTVNRDAVVSAISGANLVGIYPFREYPDGTGGTTAGFISHGPNLAASYRQLGVWTGRMLRDASLLPAQLSKLGKFKQELVVNTTVGDTLLAANKISRHFYNNLKAHADDFT
jgi:hypothetical protein